MANLVFYVDYAPLLSRVHKSAYLLYTFYDKFKNDSNCVQFTFNEINEHLGLATSTIAKAHEILQTLKLLEEVEGTQNKTYKLLPVKNLSNELKKQMVAQAKIEDFSCKTSIRKKYLESDPPVEYQQLLNKKTLQSVFKQFKTLEPKAICNILKLDFYTFKLFFEGSVSFKTRFQEITRAIKDARPSIKPVKDPITQQDRDLATYLYDTLSSLEAAPLDSRWFPRNLKIASSIHKKMSLEDSKAVVDWCFQDPWWKDKITELSAVVTAYPKFKLKNKSPSKEIKRSTLLPEVVKEELFQKVGLKHILTYEDAAFTKQLFLDGEKDQVTTDAVAILERSGVIPSGNTNLNFG